MILGISVMWVGRGYKCKCKMEGVNRWGWIDAEAMDIGDCLMREGADRDPCGFLMESHLCFFHSG